MITDMPTTEALQVVFGRRVKEHRIKSKLSQVALAKQIGMYGPDVCDIEKGRHAVTLLTVERFARAFDVPASSLLE